MILLAIAGILAGIGLTIWFVATLNEMKKSLRNINILLMHVANKAYDFDESAYAAYDESTYSDMEDEDEPIKDTPDEEDGES